MIKTVYLSVQIVRTTLILIIDMLKQTKENIIERVGDRIAPTKFKDTDPMQSLPVLVEVLVDIRDILEDIKKTLDSSGSLR